MKNFIFCICSLYGFCAFAQNGMVSVETQYQDVAHPNLSLKFNGQGFVVDYPVKSKVTNKTVNLKIVLTAAHLVFGGIYTERMDNFRIFEAESKKELYALGMISDVIHDSATIILCTQEAMDLFNEEFKAYDMDLGQLQSLGGQSFTSGGGCVPAGREGAVSKDVKSFASYKGPDLVFDSSNGEITDHMPISQGALSKAQIVVNEAQDLTFLKAGDSYAVPWIKEQESNGSAAGSVARTIFESNADNELYQTQDLKTKLVSSVENYATLSEVPAEYSIPLSLESGYSGSPITTYDAKSNQLVVTGVYKSSTQSLNADSYSSFGWASPTEISQGLLSVFLLRYPQQLHRWHTIPQVYLYLNEGNLVREFYYSDFVLRENQGDNSGDNKINENTTPGGFPNDATPDKAEAAGWIRSDTGKTLWVRSDTGKVYSSYPKSSKSLMIKYRDVFDIPETPMLLIALKNDKGLPYIILPPVMESAMFVSKENCPSCVNFKGHDLKEVLFLTYQDSNLFIDTLWSNLSGSILKNTDAQASVISNIISKKFLNANKKNVNDHIQIMYSLENGKLKVDLNMGVDSVTLYILGNNKYSYLGFDGVWKESEFTSVLETKTKLGHYAFLELAGILYYNLELQNPYSFRLKIEDQATQLFESEVL